MEQPFKIDPFLAVQSDLEIEWIDIEPVDREQIFVFPRSFRVEYDVRLQSGVEQYIPDDHLYIVRDGCNIQIHQVIDEFLDNLLLFRRFFLIRIVDADIDQEIRKPSLVIRFILDFRDKFLVLLKKKIDPEIFMIMIPQRTLVRVRDDIDDRLAFFYDLRIDGF